VHLSPQGRVHFDELTNYVADSNLKNKDTPPEAYETGLSGDDTSYEVWQKSNATGNVQEPTMLLPPPSHGI
jgi:hypothetical protein